MDKHTIFLGRNIILIFMTRNILVTGGTSGIGKAIALKFSRGGDNVVITGRNREIGRQIEEENENIIFMYADLSKTEDIDKLVKDVYDKLGRVDILVNNAGVLILDTLESLSLDDFIYTYQIHVFAPFHLMKMIIPRMVKDGGGVVINISSIAGISPYPMGGAYCSSKAALISLSKVAALEYAPKNVRVVCIAPGLVRTKMAFKDPDNMEEVDKASKNIPVGFVAEPEEIAELAYYLASDKARYVTGAVYVIDGGVTTGRFRSLVEK